ncbi:MAG: glycosyltransferase family A protein [Acidimicrobiia bacterium]
MTSSTAFTVVLRTQGRRPRGLAQALAALAVQTDADFEVQLVVHDADDAGLVLARSTVDALTPAFAARVHVVPVSGGGRSAPLNAGLDAATGSHVVFLDDDDLVEPNWVGAFRAGSATCPGAVVRARCAEQPWHGDRLTGDPIEPAGPTGQPWAPTFDLLLQIHHNESPICSFALPLEGLRARGLRFDADLPVLEDWDLFMRSVFLFGVVDVEECTSTYRRISTGTSRDVHADAVWADTIPVVRQRWGDARLPLPPGWPTTLALAYEAEVKLREATAHLQAAIGRLEHENGELHARLHAIESSKFWRMTRPLRIATRMIRGR